MFWLAPLALATAAPADAISITSPAPDKYAVTLAVLELGEGEYEGEYFPDLDENMIYAGRGDAIVRNPARTIRRLAGPAPRGLRLVRHIHQGDWSTRLFPVPRMIAVLEPTDQGYYYLQWSQVLTGRKACFPAFMREHYSLRFARPHKVNAEGDICIDV